MIIFPAIDIKDQKVVRLRKGDFNTVTVFSDDPKKVAKSFERQGASWLHIVDLDRAEKNTSNNINSIKEIKKTVSCNIQVGGGIRSLSDVKELLKAGVTRVIIGTIAISDYKLLQTMVTTFPKQIIVSIDAWNGYVKTHGWQESTTVKTIDLCADLEAIGIDTIVYTDIQKDGMMNGPNFADYKELSRQTSLNIIASGGVTSLQDVKLLQSYKLYGAIIGRAMYEKELFLPEVYSCLQDE